MLRVAIILGSSRPGRKGEPVAKWVYEIAMKRSGAEFEFVDTWKRAPLFNGARYA